MYRNETIALIIAASGTGRRMGSDIPKQFLYVDGRPCLRKTADVFSGMGIFDEIVVTAPEAYMAETREVLDGLPVTVVAGGAMRGDSVAEALKHISSRYVLIHDGVRPFVTEETVMNVIEGMIGSKAAVPAVKPKDTVRTKERTLDRDGLYMYRRA